MQTLRLFSDVARCQSFSQAAGMHGITQSAASQRIGHLEKRLGVTLLDRSVRPLELTEAGGVYLRGVQEVLQRYDLLEGEVAASFVPKKADSHPAGDVRVAAIYSSGIDLLSRVRRRFEAEQPQVSVTIDYEYPDTVYDAVVNGRADVGILSYPERFKKVGVIPLRDEPMAVVCPPDHPLAKKKSVTPEELTGHERVAFSNDLPMGRRVTNYLKENGGAPTTKYIFDNFDTIKNAVAAMGRFAILPARTVQRDVKAGVLVTVKLTPELTRPMGIIYRRGARQGAPLSPASATFVDFLIEHAGSSSATAKLNHVNPTDMLASSDEGSSDTKSDTKGTPS
ncbi:MAG: LysR family transcriptional regulator [Algisphaera sp.]